MRYILLIITLVFASSVGADYSSAQIAVDNPGCQRDYVRYRQRARHKAFALTLGKYKRQGCGMAWGYNTRANAVKRALRECAIAARREKIPRRACRIVTSQ